MRVDHQTHWLPRKCLEALRGRRRLPRSERDGDRYLLEIAPGGSVLPVTSAFDTLEVQLAEADAHGVDVLVSIPAPLAEVLHLPGEEAGDLLEDLNEEVARGQRVHRDRIIGLAMLPMQDPDVALRVLESAVAELGLRGVCMLASIDGRPIATDETLPIFQRIEELRVPLFLHPAVRSNTYVSRDQRRAESGIGWMYHTALAALNLIDSGTLDRCPELVVVHPHLGGVLPYVLGRVDRMDPEMLPRRLPEYLRTRFYTDSVGATPGALRFAMDTYGPERVLLATDYPPVPMAAGHAYVKSELGAEGAQALYANALPWP
ncbi:MAG: aminocarboxymuconate-semialdehyde decarboxylase [Solirubrobacteraceae bacterium]